MEFTFRQATEKDKEFITTVIIESEKGESNNTISYCAIFSISEDEFKELVGKILDENIEGQEMCYSNFIIAESGGEIAGTLGAFIEMKEGMPSNLIMMNLLMHFLDRNKILNAKANLALINEVNITREANTLQFEYMYIKKKFGAYGLIWSLIDEHIKHLQKSGITCNKMQRIAPENRATPLLYFERYGFAITNRVTSLNKNIFKLISSDTKILMEMNVPAI